MKTTSREEYFLADELSDRDATRVTRTPSILVCSIEQKKGRRGRLLGRIKPIKTLELKRRVSRTCFQACLSWKAAFSLFVENELHVIKVSVIRLATVLQHDIEHFQI